MSFAWSGCAAAPTICQFGGLAVFSPLLERMNLAEIINRHLPPDPQLEFLHGDVLRILLTARLCEPLALVNVAAWAQDSGVEYITGIPPDKLNDDRLGRSLDTFFDKRHDILADVADHVIRIFELPTRHLHYDLTALCFEGAYASSQPIDNGVPLPPAVSSSAYPPAHITHGYPDKDKKVQVGLLSVVDELGSVPIHGHTLSGNRNGQTGIAQQFELMHNYLPVEKTLMISDRGTYSAAHAHRMHRAGHRILCSVSWNDFRPLFHEHRAHLHWREASYRSIEQQRRRDTGSSLPLEHYELAVLKHTIIDPDTQAELPARIIFVHSSADAKAEKQNRERNIAKIRAGLEKIQRAVHRGHPNTKLERIPVRVAELFGTKEAAHYFRWQLVPLAANQRPREPGTGRCTPTHRFEFSFDEAAAQADAQDDGYYALITTAFLHESADCLFTQFKRQAFVELSHHQWKTPIAVRPVFLKSPERVEALVYLLKIALTAYHLLQRLYRQQAVRDNAPLIERRTTTETILRAFTNCTLQVVQQPLGRVVNVTQLTRRQRDILLRLRFPTPMQQVRKQLPRYPNRP